MFIQLNSFIRRAIQAGLQRRSLFVPAFASLTLVVFLRRATYKYIGLYYSLRTILRDPCKHLSIIVLPCAFYLKYMQKLTCITVFLDYFQHSLSIPPRRGAMKDCLRLFLSKSPKRYKTKECLLPFFSPCGAIKQKIVYTRN